jgi:hypothetical protein
LTGLGKGLIYALAAFQAGCAGLAAGPVNDERQDKSARGFRYFQPAAFLIIHTDNKGGLTSQIQYLPDTTRRMSVRPYSYGATNEFELKFHNGMLTQASSDVDETIVPKAVLDALKDVLTAAAALNAPPLRQGTTAPAPVIYKIEVRGSTIVLKGGGSALGPDGKPVVINTAVKVGP